MLSLFENQDLLDCIGESSSKGARKLSNKEYLLWESVEQLVKRWILDSLSKEVFDFVLVSGTASDVWANLEDTFGSTASMSSSRSFQLSAQYPYPSKINVSHFVSVKLSNGNYDLWKAQMLCLIKSPDLLGFIRKGARRATVGLSTEELLIWKKSDGLVKGWILGSLSEEALSNMFDPVSKSASDVWAQLEHKHSSIQAYPSTLDVSNFLFIKLDKYNYVPWREQMLFLIESQHLLDFIDERSSSRESELSDEEYFVWKRSDQLVKGWILGSLTEELFQTLIDLCTAIDVWTKPENTLGGYHRWKAMRYPTVSTKEEYEPTKAEDRIKYLPLYRAALKGDLERAKEFFIIDKDAITARITCCSKTALHVNVLNGKSTLFAEKLIDLMANEGLALTDTDGNTAFT